VPFAQVEGSSGDGKLGAAWSAKGS
jgi:hypothetical protein